MVPKGWSEKSLSEICDKQISYGIVQTGPDLNDGIPCLRVVDLTKPKMNPTEMIKTSPEIHDSYKKTILALGEIVMALRGEVGLARMIDEELVGTNITRGLARLSADKNQVVPEFLLWELRSPKFRGDLIRRVGGSALQEISLSELRKVRALLPPLPEQKKIAQILSTWDQAITATERLLENSQQRKKGLMQQLLTGKKRLPGFEGEWEETPLGNLFAERSEIGVESLPLLSITSADGVVYQDETGRKDTSNADKSKYKRICPGDIGYNTMRMWQGRSSLSDKDGVVSPAYTILAPGEDADSLFFSYLFKLSEMIHVFYRHSQGLVSDTWNLKYNHFRKIVWKVPPKTEQSAIAKILLASDFEINALKVRIDCLNQEKKALMQQLLTGKRRVNVETEAA